jgi:hypothetical protein
MWSRGGANHWKVIGSRESLCRALRVGTFQGFEDLHSLTRSASTRPDPTYNLPLRMPDPFKDIIGIASKPSLRKSSGANAVEHNRLMKFSCKPGGTMLVVLSARSRTFLSPR